MTCLEKITFQQYPKRTPEAQLQVDKCGDLICTPEIMKSLFLCQYCHLPPPFMLQSALDLLDLAVRVRLSCRHAANDCHMWEHLLAVRGCLSRCHAAYTSPDGAQQVQAVGGQGHWHVIAVTIAIAGATLPHLGNALAHAGVNWISRRPDGRGCKGKNNRNILPGRMKEARRGRHTVWQEQKT
jgi:hypothetical protein